MRVLIADDDRAFSALVAGWLRGKGHIVQVTFDAATTLMAAMHDPPDVIVLDVQMPAGSGLDTLRKLKNLPRTAGVPVIVASAVEDPTLGDRATGLGAVRFLPKPIRLEDLDAALRNAFGSTPS